MRIKLSHITRIFGFQRNVETVYFLGFIVNRISLMPFICRRVVSVLWRWRRIRRGTIRSLLAAVAVRIQSALTVKTLLIVEAVLTVRILLTELTVETSLLSVNTSRVSRKAPDPSGTKTRITSTVTGKSSSSASSVKWSSSAESLLSVTTGKSSWKSPRSESSQSSAERLSTESSWLGKTANGLLAVKALLIIADGRLCSVKWWS